MATLFISMSKLPDSGETFVYPIVLLNMLKEYEKGDLIATLVELIPNMIVFGENSIKKQS